MRKMAMPPSIITSLSGIFVLFAPAGKTGCLAIRPRAGAPARGSIASCSPAVLVRSNLGTTSTTCPPSSPHARTTLRSMTCSPGLSPNGSPLQKSPLPDSSTPQPALGFLTISLHTIDHQPRGAITFAHNGCRKLRAYAYDSSCLTVSTFNLGGHPYSASNLQ